MQPELAPEGSAIHLAGHLAGAIGIDRQQRRLLFDGQLHRLAVYIPGRSEDHAWHIVFDSRAQNVECAVNVGLEGGVHAAHGARPRRLRCQVIDKPGSPTCLRDGCLILDVTFDKPKAWLTTQVSDIFQTSA